VTHISAGNNMVLVIPNTALMQLFKIDPPFLHDTVALQHRVSVTSIVLEQQYIYIIPNMCNNNHE